MKDNIDQGKWALILGGSSGLGLATAIKLAETGYNILVVHRDRKTAMPAIEEGFQTIREEGVRIINFNADALNSESRKDIIDQIKQSLSPNGKISVLIHSIAKGHLKPMVSDNTATLNVSDLQLTINAMALSLYDWTKELYSNDLFSKDTRIISFTSEGNTKALPYYAAVSAAKVALEAITRSIALEFAQKGIRANCVQAGVTDTASFNMIPNSDKIKEAAIRRNPNRRLTEPTDIANVVYLLCREEARWITGTIIKADGGESLL